MTAVTQTPSAGNVPKANTLGKIDAGWFDAALLLTALGLATVSTDNAIARFNGTTGGTQNSGVIIDDSNNVTGVVALTIGGALSGVTNLTASGKAIVGATALDADYISAFGTPYISSIGGNNSAYAFVGLSNINTGVGAYILGAHTRSTGTDAATIVQSGDTLAHFGAFGADGAAFQEAGYMEFSVGGTPGAGDMPGTWKLFVTPGGSVTPGLAVTVDSTKVMTLAGTTASTSTTTGSLIVAGGVGIAGSANIGTNLNVSAAALDADVTNAFGTPRIALVADNNASDSFVSIGVGNHTIGPHIYGAKTRSTGSDANTVVQSGDQLLNISGYGASANADFRSGGALLLLADGAPSGTIVPAKWELHTRNAAGTQAARLTISAEGKIAASSGFDPDAGGLKHARVTTGSVSAGSTALVTITWGTAFADANYTVQASVVDSTTSSLSLSVVHIESISASAVTVRVLNNAIGSLTGTVHCTAIHD